MTFCVLFLWFHSKNFIIQIISMSPRYFHNFHRKLQLQNLLVTIHEILSQAVRSLSQDWFVWHVFVRVITSKSVCVLVKGSGVVITLGQFYLGWGLVANFSVLSLSGVLSFYLPNVLFHCWFSGAIVLYDAFYLAHTLTKVCKVIQNEFCIKYV